MIWALLAWCVVLSALAFWLSFLSWRNSTRLTTHTMMIEGCAKLLRDVNERVTATQEVMNTNSQRVADQINAIKQTTAALMMRTAQDVTN